MLDLLKLIHPDILLPWLLRTESPLLVACMALCMHSYNVHFVIFELPVPSACLCACIHWKRAIKVLLPLVCRVIDHVHMCLFACWGIKRVPISFNCRRNKKCCECRSCPSKAFCSWLGLEYHFRNLACCECIDDCVLCVMHALVSCHLEYAQHDLFVESQFLYQSLLIQYFSPISRAKNLKNKIVHAFYIVSMNFIFFRHFKSMEKLRKGLWSMIKQQENPVAMVLSLTKIWNQLSVHWVHLAS